MFDIDRSDASAPATASPVVSAARAFVEALAAAPTEHLDPEAVAAEFVELQRILDRVEAEMLRRLRRIGTDRPYVAEGYRSTTAFVKHATRMRGATARRMVARARALAEMPATEERFRRGELSGDETSLLVATRESEPEAFGEWEEALCDAARTVEFVDDLRRVVDYWRQHLDPPEPADTEPRRWARLRRDFDGMWELTARLTPLQGAAVRQALEEATPAPDPDDPRTGAQRRADTLVRLLTRSDRPSTRLVVHVGYETFVWAVAGEPPCPGFDSPLRPGGPIGGAEAAGVLLGGRDLAVVACDAAVRRIVFGPDSMPLDVGRSTRTIPAHLRAAVIARDGRCVHPGCDRGPEWCDVHHLVPWAEGGATDLRFLVLVCRHHHTFVHARGLTYVRTEDGWRLAQPP